MNLYVEINTLDYFIIYSVTSYLVFELLKIKNVIIKILIPITDLLCVSTAKIKNITLGKNIIIISPCAPTR
jgi:hypothetical protein